MEDVLMWGWRNVAWLYSWVRHRGTSSSPVLSPCLGVAWAVTLYFCIITYSENIVIIRVREDVARHRYKHVFSNVRKGVIVCVVTQCITPPETSQCLALKFSSLPPLCTYLITPWWLVSSYSSILSRHVRGSRVSEVNEDGSSDDDILLNL